MGHQERVDALLNRERLTAPHFMAYRWVRERLAWAGCLKVMDFGARYSLLPSILAVDGHSVVAVDRDPVVVQQQGLFARQHGVEIEARVWTPDDPISEDLKLDAVTACWAIQHNDLLEQRSIHERLLQMLRPGGRLLVVGSLSDGETFHQTNREDPQWVLSIFDHLTLIGDVGRQLAELRTFWYEHSTTRGDWSVCCEDARPANAVCYELVK